MKIERNSRRAKFYLAGILSVCAMAAAFLTVDVAKSTALTQARPESITGFGYATVQPFAPAVGHDGQPRLVPSIGGVEGNLISFQFFATKDEMGQVRGEMFFIDYTQKMVITSDVASFSIPHPVIKRIFGNPGLTFNMSSSTQSVRVNNEPRPGWKFVNGPSVDTGSEFNGAGDGVCFELFDDQNKKVFQWGGPLSFGSIVIK